MKARLIRWYYTVCTFRNYAKDLNRRAGVEAVLLDVANGKRPMLTQQECRMLAFKLCGYKE